LENEQGHSILDHAGIEHELINYYKSLLTEPSPNHTTAIDKITRHIPNIINAYQNATLLCQISIEEVDQAVKEMPIGKAPGLDDLPQTSSTTVGRWFGKRFGFLWKTHVAPKTSSQLSMPLSLLSFPRKNEFLIQSSSNPSPFATSSTKS
jgi:hypothetical protein